MTRESFKAPDPCLGYTFSEKARSWDEIDAERDRRFRELIGEELDDWLEEVCHGQAAD